MKWKVNEKQEKNRMIVAVLTKVLLTSLLFLNVRDMFQWTNKLP